MGAVQSIRQPSTRTYSTRDTSIDIVKGIAILLVIAIHVTAYFPYIIHGSKTFFTLIVVDVFSQMAVPLFLLVSGYMERKSFDKKGQPPTLAYYAKKMTRIVPLYVAFSVFYYLFFQSNLVTIEDFVRRLVSGGAAYHLWFVPALIIVYLIVPLLAKIVAEAGDRRIFHFSLWGIVTLAVVIPLMTTGPYNTYLPTVILFFLLGYTFRREFLPDSEPISNVTKAINVALLATVVTYVWAKFGESFLMYDTRPTIYRVLEYPALAIVNLTSLLFVFLNRKRIARFFDRVQLFTLMGRYSFEIYLVHAYLLMQVKIFADSYLLIDANRWYYYLLLFVGATILSVPAGILVSKLYSLLLRYTPRLWAPLLRLFRSRKTSEASSAL